MTDMEKYVADLMFDDVVTGDIPLNVRGVRVSMSPGIPGPVAAHAAVGYGYEPMLTPRHVRLEQRSTAMMAFIALVMVAVAAEAALVIGFVAALSMIGGAR